MLDALLRLLRLADEGSGAAFMAPLVKEELYFRLLMSPAAGAFRALFSSGTPESRIREAAAWMRANYRRDFDVADTASRFGMSAATFYRYFREILGASPRQYVKTLRLYEAKRLMMDEGMDAAAAAFEVGYESAAYFSREYKRAFGLPPKAQSKPAGPRLRMRPKGEGEAAESLRNRRNPKEHGIPSGRIPCNFLGGELILQNVVDDGKRIQGPREAEEGKTHFERIDQVLLHGAYGDVSVHMGAHLRFAAAERDD